MTHDLHYYGTFMCAINAGFSVESSHMIALFADAVDGGTPKEYLSGQLVGVKTGTNNQPLTVYQELCDVNFHKSRGSSIMALPWIAFHFLPSLETHPEGYNDYSVAMDKLRGVRKKRHLNEIDRMEQMKHSKMLQSGLVCSSQSQFGARLIKETKKRAVAANRKKISVSDAAQIGVRCHIISDLFAHEGYAGCRAMDINALKGVSRSTQRTEEKEYTVSIKSELGKLQGKGGISRLGHGQAGQLPDEPFLKYRWARARGGRVFTKDNYDIFGNAMVVLSDTLTQTRKTARNDKLGWERNCTDQSYRWTDVRMLMNRTRGKRMRALHAMIYGRELPEKNAKNGADIGLHNGSDTWAFEQMKKRGGNYLTEFANAAEDHFKWFHKNFESIMTCNIADYLDMSVLYAANISRSKKVKLGAGLSDYLKALKINETLQRANGTYKIGKNSGTMNQGMIGAQHMMPSKITIGDDSLPTGLTPSALIEIMNV